jgi:hypothetical protein
MELEEKNNIDPEKLRVFKQMKEETKRMMELAQIDVSMASTSTKKKKEKHT